jgi:hypothetical protein
VLIPSDVSCRYVKNGDLVSMIRREKCGDAEWSWVRSEEGAEGYILGSRLQERNLQEAIFDSVAESELFFQLVHIMAENDHAGKAHGIIVLLLSASLSCDKILRSIIIARPSCSVVGILSVGLESSAAAVGSCAAIKVLLRVLHFHMIDAASRTTLSVESWVVAAQRVLRCMHITVFETDPVTPLVLEELNVSFDFLQSLLSWSAAQCVIKQQLFPSSVFPNRSSGDTFLTVLQQLLSVIAVGGTGAGLSRVMTALVEPAPQQVGQVHYLALKDTRLIHSASG